MKPPITRWKIVPLYSGSVVFSRVPGWVHSRRPSARSAKLATVFGAWSGKRSTVMSPWLVCSTARRAGVDSVTPPLSHRRLRPGWPGPRRFPGRTRGRHTSTVRGHPTVPRQSPVVRGRAGPVHTVGQHAPGAAGTHDRDVVSDGHLAT